MDTFDVVAMASVVAVISVVCAAFFILGGALVCARCNSRGEVGGTFETSWKCGARIPTCCGRCCSSEQGFADSLREEATTAPRGEDRRVLYHLANVVDSCVTWWNNTRFFARAPPPSAELRFPSWGIPASHTKDAQLDEVADGDRETILLMQQQMDDDLRGQSWMDDIGTNIHDAGDWTSADAQLVGSVDLGARDGGIPHPGIYEEFI